MFGLFGPEKVQYVGLKGAMLTFRSGRKKQKVGRPLRIQLAVPVETRVENVKLEVIVDSFRPLPDGGSIVSGRALVDENYLKTLETLLAGVQKPDLGRSARRSERVDVSLRVLSQEVPGYRGVTVDISLHGVQLAIEGPMEPGSYLNLTLELEQSNLPQLTLQGVVVWCRESGKRKSFNTGIEFTQQHPEVQQLWQQTYHNLLVRQKGSVLQRSLSDGNFLIRENEE
ncbi:MAG: PilZ domain-containing protein [Vulcanimicrobiota bacterium]